MLHRILLLGICLLLTGCGKGRAPEALAAAAENTPSPNVPENKPTQPAQAAQTNNQSEAAKREAAKKQAIAAAEWAKHVPPFITKYCAECHSAAKKRGGLDLVSDKTLTEALKHRKGWEEVVQNVLSRDMPPANKPQPKQDEIDQFVATIQASLSQADCGKRDPGRVTLRRLNRAEYNNTVRDLCGIDFKPADDFPSDDVGYGFDNIGDVLSLPPILLEKYLGAAEKILDKSIGHQAAYDASTRRFVLSQMRPSTGKKHLIGPNNRWQMLLTNGDISDNYLATKNADYVLKARVYGDQAGSEPVKMAFKVDDKVIKTFEVKAVDNVKPDVHEARFKLTEGNHKIAVEFLNDFYDDKSKKDRNLIVTSLEIAGPLFAGGAPLPESHRRILIAEPSAGASASEKTTTARKVIENFARRAFRRPVTADEVNRLMKMYELGSQNGENWETSVKLALKAVLVSPHFLFRVEIDREPNNPDAAHPVNDFEFASRLSYFLWQSMPDEELFGLAAKGAIRKPEVLATQVQRMLKDPRSSALTDGFAGQWLQLRSLDTLTPDKDLFRSFDLTLRQAMKRETELVFEHIVRENRSILEFIDADYTFLNERLAKHYGIFSLKGPEFRKVTLPAAQAAQRGGILTHASILTLTSNPTRTSPVKRGKWILDNILGTPPPPAPPDVPELADDKGVPLKGTLRQRMEQHRENPSCASCHNRMDPLGFAFENFDAIGAFRTMDGKDKIDPSGVLPTGQKFKGPQELKKILKGRAHDFAKCFTEKLLTFALGRGLEHYDRCSTETMAKNVAAEGFKFHKVVMEIVQSEPFQNRRGQ